MNKVPVILLSGFLGSGKTTLLLRLLQEAKSRQLRTAVLMNELGQTDVDGGFIQSDLPSESLEKLMDGCICCSKKSEVTASVKRLIDQHPDVLFIELTGVANPEEVADALTEPHLLNRVELRHMITVLDSEWVLEYNSMFNTDQALKHTLHRQMDVADIILINKTDLASSSQLLKIKAVVKKQNPKAVIHFTQHSQADLSHIFSGIEPLALPVPVKRTGFRVMMSARKPEPSADPVHDHQHEHKDQTTTSTAKASFSRVQTITLPIPEYTKVTVKQVEQFFHRWGDGLLRAKGFVALSDSESNNILFQFAGKRIHWEISDYSGPSYLVLIGIDLNRQQLEQDWNQLFVQRTGR
ncbi:CobW family GTP-binding protein [Paenibacillus turpanensis]|uniref:CobW family GTP-binding protein n=1 Tax=Paenibacillus turpanensis TaxID=2689078 RepID=UPI00140E380C|nr:GTP-binding protein [Paenibacillus turpanensis]